LNRSSPSIPLWFYIEASIIKHQLVFRIKTSTSAATHAIPIPLPTHAAHSHKYNRVAELAIIRTNVSSNVAHITLIANITCGIRVLRRHHCARSWPLKKPLARSISQAIEITHGVAAEAHHQHQHPSGANPTKHDHLAYHTDTTKPPFDRQEKYRWQRPMARTALE
jgi:hypothetical protein